MTRLTALLLTAALIAIALPALATEKIVDGYYTVAWETGEPHTGTGADAPWPQTLEAWTGPTGKANLNALDSVLPECGFFQIDVYKIDSERDRAKLAWLLDKGTLDWPEDSSIYHSSKFAENECETATTSSTTPTTVQVTTTTEPDATTTSLEDSSTTVAPAPPTEPPANTLSPNTLTELPFTDRSETGDLVRLAAVIGLVGLLGVGLARRLRHD